MHEAATGVGHSVKLFAAFGEVGGESVELLDFGVLHRLLLGAVVFFHELVVLLVLVLLFGEAIVVELLFVDAVDDEEVVADFLFKAQGQNLVFARLVVARLVDLVLGLLEFAEDFVALDEVLADAAFEVLLAGYALKEEVLQDVVVVRDLGLLLDGLTLALLVLSVLLDLAQVGHY